jgi:hypothetical protein
VPCGEAQLVFQSHKKLLGAIARETIPGYITFVPIVQLNFEKPPKLGELPELQPIV